MSIEDYLPRDTCPEHPSRCPTPDYGRAYFVSVRDGDRWGVLAGPYTTHPDALAAVDAAYDAALDVDPWATFYAFGTMMGPATLRPKFGRL